MAEVNDKHSGVVGEKSTYAIDASGQKGDVRLRHRQAMLFSLLRLYPSCGWRCQEPVRTQCMLSFVQVIYVEDTFNSDEAEGVRLTEELTVGKQMAGGTQVNCL